MISKALSLAAGGLSGASATSSILLQGASSFVTFDEGESDKITVDVAYFKALQTSLASLTAQVTALSSASAFAPKASEPKACDSSSLGATWFDTSTKEFKGCDGDEWKALNEQPKGSITNPGVSCKDIKDDNLSSPDGTYFIQGATESIEVFCDMTTAGGGWTQLMRVDASATLNYESSHWTTATTLNPENLTPDDNLFKSKVFNEMDVTELLLKSGGQFSTVTLSSAPQPLMTTFASGTTQYLSAGLGQPNAVRLATGADPGCGGTVCGADWRINSRGQGRTANTRLGTWIAATWGCTYTADEGGAITSAHWAGFGISDSQWCPCEEGNKGFGLRDAHGTSYSTCIGQTAYAAQIWGR